jgi:hypothetical protein
VAEAAAAATVHGKGLEVVAAVAVAECTAVTQLSAVTVTTTPTEERMVAVKAVGKPVAIAWWR